MNELTGVFRFKTMAWIYYWRLRFGGYRPTKPYLEDTFLWGKTWVVEWPALRHD